MEDLRKDEITYDEDWQRFDSPTKVEETEKEEVFEKQAKEDKNKKREKMFPRLITIQLFLCLLVAFAVFMLKAMSSDFFYELSKWYDEMMSETLVSSGAFENIDLSEYFTSTPDELNSTNDEAHS